MGGLDGRVIAISGVGGGLGPEVAKRLADDGATLAFCDRDADKMAAVGEALGLPKDRLDVRVVDLMSPDDSKAWCDSLVERFGHVDGLLHLVGGWRGGDPIESFDMSDYNWLHDLLVVTTMNVTRAFHDALADSGNGRFAIVSSKQAQFPEAKNAAYAATKGAAETWTLALADSFAGTGATANIVVINAILTKRMREAHPRKEYPGFTPAEAIADALAFLCSDSAARMNGQRLSLHP